MTPTFARVPFGRIRLICLHLRRGPAAPTSVSYSAARVHMLLAIEPARETVEVRLTPVGAQRNGEPARFIYAPHAAAVRCDQQRIVRRHLHAQRIDQDA